MTLFIIIIVLCGSVLGFITGAVKQLGAVAGIVLGVIAARRYSDIMERLLRGNVEVNEVFYSHIASLATFLLVFVLCLLAAHLLNSVVEKVGLSPLNRLAGALLGGLKYVLVLSVLFNILQLFDTKSRLISKDTKKNSQGYVYVVKIAPILLEMKE